MATKFVKNQQTLSQKAWLASLLRKLRQTYPHAACSLAHQNPFELLVATVLSAQCTDERVNQVTPALFATYPTPKAMAAAPIAQLETLIFSTGFYRNKAKNLKALAQKLCTEHRGNVPDDFQALIALPGVARKTANVVLGVAFGRAEGVVVDTHVMRLSQRLGLTQAQNPIHIERELMQLLPQPVWIVFSHWLIVHGRRVCMARNPQCQNCVLSSLCPQQGIG